MTNVTRIEMAHACALDVAFTLPGIPTNLRLFPKATSITLAGYMSDDLASAILEAGDPARITYLPLDCFRGLPGRELDHGFRPGLYEIPRLPDYVPYKIFTKFSSLRHLEIVENGHLIHGTLFDQREWRRERDMYGDIHRLYAMLIRNTKPTLDTLTFVNNPAVEKETFTEEHPIKFCQWIDPVLKKGPWPRLRVLNVPVLDEPYTDTTIWVMDILRGVGRQDSDAPGCKIYTMGEVFVSAQIRPFRNRWS